MPANYPGLLGLSAPRNPLPQTRSPLTSANDGPGGWFPTGSTRPINPYQQGSPYLNEHGVDPRIGQTGPLGQPTQPTIPPQQTLPPITTIPQPASSGPGPTVTAPSTQSQPTFNQPVSNPTQPSYSQPPQSALPQMMQQYSQPQTPSRFGQINTSINPTNVYSEQMTQEAINQSRADAAQQANLPWLLRQFARPGVSQNSPSAIARAMPIVGAAQTAIGRAGTEIPFSDSKTNLENWRAGEVSREQEAQGLAGIMQRNQAIDRDFGNAHSSILANILAQLMG